MGEAAGRQYTYASHGEADTDKLAAALGELAEAGAVLALDGELGAGKTRFSQAFARALGVRGVVNSPTFTIIKEYAGRLPLYHMDVYRLSAEEADELGLDDYFYGDGVTLVEWASLIEELLPRKRLEVRIAHGQAGGPGSERELTLTPHGEPYEGWCRKLAAVGLLQKPE
jgi:tRNA threonylcarbamoyladenosine biosynthesis protein TsaE